MKSSFFHIPDSLQQESAWHSKELIRSELFSAERLEQHAASLAAEQRVASGPVAGRPLVSRLRDNGKVLRAAYHAIAGAIREGRAISPAAEWLVDNYHVVDAQIQQIKDDLPPGYYRQLPKLAGGPLAGYPRVVGVAWAFVAHTDSRFDPQLLRRFVRAYQQVQPLTIGELWALAITLRLVLVENLRRAAERIADGRAARQQADALADRLLGLYGAKSTDATALLRALDGAPLSTSFSVQLLHRLRDQDPGVGPTLDWLTARFAAQGTTADETVCEEHHRQGASNLTVRNVITSMRAISSSEWPDIVESLSLVDAAFRAASDFAQMDFPTRDLYRKGIEELARGSRLTELEIAGRVIRAASGGGTARERDPGFHIIAGGRRALEVAIGYRPRLRHWFARLSAKAGLRGYLIGVAAATATVLALPLLALAAAGIADRELALLAILGFIPAVDAAMSLVNRSVTQRLGAKAMPALELRSGIPADLRTLIAVPTLLTTRQALANQLRHLETHHLASPDGDLSYALLTDWPDASQESLPSDDLLPAAAAAGIALLNQRYGPSAGGARFMLLHRRRRWCPVQRAWIGWERKRGKLHELNRLLRGAMDTSFIAVADVPPSVPAGVRYVITLDADTRLPRDTARRLVGKMAHPLNAPRLDVADRRVVEGYAILQPRVTPSLPMAHEGSLFQRLYSSTSGIDPYSAAVSDVYQDLCGEGSYVGKGIYDVDAFEDSLADRVPDGTLLSHDLFEGTFARAGLVSDIEVVEEYPARYDVAAARSHRWARGDWQLLPWMLGRRAASGTRRLSRIPLIGLWKMLDNLRRTQSAPASTTALIVGWTLPAHAALMWTAFILLVLAIPPLSPALTVPIWPRAGVSLRSHLRTLFADLRVALSQTALLVVFLAHQSWLMGDAIARTLYRLCVSHRRLLEWLTAAQAQTHPRPDLATYFRRMSGAMAIGFAVIAVVWATRGNLALALPFALAWMFSPVVARWVSQSPAVPEHLRINAEDSRALRLVARRAWQYFDTFVTAADHQLPPDNFQEEPQPVLAHRTSPTNIGLYLLALVTARDFGWLGTVDMIERLKATLSEVKRLERFRGHLYNWYATQDGRPLEPRYISTVDSGNLAAHLITLANACSEMSRLSAPGPGPWQGILDTAELSQTALLTQAARNSDGDDARAGSAVQASMTALLASLRQAPPAKPETSTRLAQLATAADALVTAAASVANADLQLWAQATRAAVASHQRDCSSGPANRAYALLPALAARLTDLAGTARSLAEEMRFDFLYDTERKLLSIGFRVDENALDPGCYDLLASEARLASFIAIAYGDLPARHWFRLGRAVTPVGHGAALISWSGSMFEYLMPSLVMRAPTGSLLAQTNRLIVKRQMAYGADLRVPWGISESAYNARDMELTYQYSSFGVPDLGLKRGLGDSVVIAPYATALASMIEPQAALRNLQRLAAAGAQGRYGFYEALDYTPRRLPAGQTVAVVRAYMAHHLGMTIVALANALTNGSMRARFHAEPRVQATELLLQERSPREVAMVELRVEDTGAAAALHEAAPMSKSLACSAHDPTPRVRLLSNGSYAVMLTGAGSGYSRWRDLAVTRWQEDVTRDDFGSYVFLRDVENGEVWSAGFQPTGVEPEEYRVEFHEDRASYARTDGTLLTTLEVVVSAESDAEVRRVSVTNRGHRDRIIEWTSYAELVLAPAAADSAHPAFSKLFVETEYLANIGALLATRRCRSSSDSEVWAAHLAIVEGEILGEAQFESDRARFIGRGRELRTALALSANHALSGSAGTVLDPIFSLRRRLRIAPGATARVAYWTVVASTRNEALDLADKHRDAAALDRATTLAWTQAQVQLHHLGISDHEANLFQRLASHLIYSDPTLRPPSAALAAASGGQALLWAHGVSGKLPIVLIRIDDLYDIDVVRQLLRAFEYWRLKQLAVDLVILNERAPSYTQDLQVALEQMIRAVQARSRAPAESIQGNIAILRSDIIPNEVRRMLLTAARAVLLSRSGSLAEQVERLDGTANPSRWPTAAPPARDTRSPDGPRPAENLEFFNGLGGFADHGREYLTILRDGQSTPAPWINVIANATFGFQVSASGSGYTWAGNSRDNQLTPWSNDPVSDRPGEVIYLRDEDTGELWGPTALPIRHDPGVYIARHGRGYSRFEHQHNGITLELLQFVPLDGPVKVSRLEVRNESGRTRRLSVTAFVEWVLGATRGASAPFLATSIDNVSGALLARNLWADHGSRVAFLDLGGRQTSYTGDRREFIGRNGTMERPLALTSATALSGRTGAGLDPCGALQTTFTLAPGASVQLVCLLGEAAGSTEVQALISHWREADLDAALNSVVHRWDEFLGAVVVHTPDRSFDLMLNGWLLYQTMACRILARSAFYQASGAYGFRDQLQDTMALMHAAPSVTRAHLLRSAARQFLAGDVQHWWLPESGRGVRTRVSDDCGWLCHCVAHYLEGSADLAILDEALPFLEGAALEPGETDRFFKPVQTEESASLYEHCARALDHSLAVGAHGLPLMGAGDWNDGMNLVGAGGRGESVWLAWLLHRVLCAFAPLAAARGEADRAARWRSHAGTLSAALERDGWDGEWYRRGYFDDGTPLGSAGASECRIDAIAQSWGVISGVADPGRARRAMAAVEQHLIRREEQLSLLFTPPFNHSMPNPGYIKAYPPGIRENGGQYTHAAIWSAIAYAELGDGDQAMELLALLNPINHALTPEQTERYKVEPFVIAADVYSVAPHVGRGGWTWYTGSAAWMYRAGLEWILGCRLHGATLVLDPCLPRTWPSASVMLRYRSSRYEISIQNPRGVCRGIADLQLDGQPIHDAQGRVPLVNDGATHHVQVVLG